jgi:hypothetical protein
MSTAETQNLTSRLHDLAAQTPSSSFFTILVRASAPKIKMSLDNVFLDLKN